MPFLSMYPLFPLPLFLPIPSRQPLSSYIKDTPIPIKLILIGLEGLDLGKFWVLVIDNGYCRRELREAPASEERMPIAAGLLLSFLLSDHNVFLLAPTYQQAYRFIHSNLKDRIFIQCVEGRLEKTNKWELEPRNKEWGDFTFPQLLKVFVKVPNNIRI